MHPSNASIRARLAAAAIFLLLLPTAVPAGMLKYVDENGNVVFVDSVDKIPPDRRERMEKAATGGASVSVLPDPRIESTIGAYGAGGANERSSGNQGRFIRKKPKSYLKATLYVRPGCGWCTKEREWLRAQGIPFVEKDIRKDESARSRLLELIGEEAVPTIEIEGEVVRGFNPAAIQKIVTAHVL